jgi:hypothetical protein
MGERGSMFDGTKFDPEFWQEDPNEGKKQKAAWMREVADYLTTPGLDRFDKENSPKEAIRALAEKLYKERQQEKAQQQPNRDRSEELER